MCRIYARMVTATVLLGCQPFAGGLGGNPEVTSGSAVTSEDASGTDPTDTSAASSSSTASAEVTSTGGTDPMSTGSSGPPPGDDESTTGEPDPPLRCIPLVVEALTSLDGSDDGREWVVLHNPCEGPLDLAGLSLAWGGMSYAGAIALEGVVRPGECLVVGGPTSDAGNFQPPLDLVVDFEPNLSRNPGAIGLFLGAPEQVDTSDVPLDVVIYGDSNAGFLDPEGNMPGPMAPGTADLVSLRRTSPGATWELADPPTPNACPRW